MTEQAGESVSTLALVPTAAPVILVFETRRQSRGPRQAPATVEVRAYLRPLADPRVRPRVDLRLTVDAGEGRAVPLSFFGSGWGVYGFIGAGDEISVVRFTMAPVELRALVAGEGVTGEVMGFSFALRRDQLDALRDFADLVESGNRTPR